MSYVLKLWEPPVGRPAPADARAVAGELDRLQGLPGGNPRFLALAQRLTAKFPCITSPQAQDMPQSRWAWSDGPLDGRTDEAVYAIGLRTGMLEQVRPFVIEQARALGLGVLDEQAGMAYLPDGVVLGQTDSAGPAADAHRGESYTTADLEGLVFKAMGSLLASEGYKGRKGDFSFTRKFPGGWHRVTLVMQDAWGGIEVGSFIDTRLDCVVDLYFKAIPPGAGTDPARKFTSRILQQRWMARTPGFVDGSSYKYMVGSPSEAEHLGEHFATHWKSMLRPVLDQLETVEGMDQAMNTQPLADSLLFRDFTNMEANILAAYLARNPRLAELCDEILAGTRLPHHLEPARRCVDYVRSHPLD